MEKQNVIFIGIVVVIVVISLGLSYMSGMMFPAEPQAGASNHPIKAEVVADGNYLTFRYIPNDSMTGPVTAIYQVKNDTKTLFNDKKIFESVTPDNPIEIALKKSDNGTYTMMMLISDKRDNTVHTSITTWYGSNASFSTNPASLNVISRS